MGESNRYKNCVVIAPSRERDSFLRMREKEPLLDFSFYSPDDVISLFSYQYDYRAVRFLLSKGHSYNLANDELKTISFLSKDKYKSPKLNSLLPLRDELIKEKLIYLPIYPYRSFEGKDVIYHDLLSAKDISDRLGEGHNMSMSFDFEDEPDKRRLQCLSFHDIYEEAHYVCNLIAKDIASGTSPNDIYVGGLDEEEASLLTYFSKGFHLSFDIKEKRSLFESGAYRLFRASYLENDLSKALEIMASSTQSSGDLQAISSFVARFDGLFASKEEMVSLYDSIAKTLKASGVKLDPSIKIIEGFYAPEGSHVYLLNFAEGVYPSVSRDTDYLSDAEKDELSLKTSKEENLEKRGQLLRLLLKGNIISLSYHLTPDGKTFPSPIISESHPLLSIETIDKIPLLEKEYGGEAFAFIEASLCDDETLLGKSDPRLASFKKSYPIPYLSFSYASKPIHHDIKNGIVKLSASSLSTFYTCRFKYFLSKVLGADDSDDTFALFLGDVSHKVLENMYHDGFEYSSSFDKAKEEIAVIRGPLSAKEEVLLIKLKEELRWAVEWYQAHEKPDKMNLSEPPLTEYDFKLSPQESPNLVLEGRIDKIVITDDKYITLVDYKTGSSGLFKENLLPYGVSIQLPLYSYVASHDKRFFGKELLGLFIGRVLDSDPKAAEGGDRRSQREKFFKLKGVFWDNQEAVHSLDFTFGSSDFLAGCRLTNKNQWWSGGGFRSESVMADYGKEALKLSLETEKAIRSGDFSINPVRIGKSFSSCDSCPFHDVCYRPDGAVKYIHIEKDEKDDEEEKDDEQ